MRNRELEAYGFTPNYYRFSLNSAKNTYHYANFSRFWQNSLIQTFWPSPIKILLMVVTCLLIISAAMLLNFTVRAQEDNHLSVSYDSKINLIELTLIESSLSAKSITAPLLAMHLLQIGYPNLLTEISAGNWLLAAALSTGTGVRLDATAKSISTLRLQSNPVASVLAESETEVRSKSMIKPSFIRAEYGGHLLVGGIELSSWDTTKNAADTTIEDGRSYALAYRSERVDILRSEVSYLGAEADEKSGLAWRHRLDFMRPETGATGRVEESKIHHNYFGLYTFEAVNMSIFNNEFYENIQYGIDPHDNSQNLEIAYITVYKNGLHGIILSCHCVNNSIHHNEVFDNAGHGIMFDRGSNNNVVASNLIYQNQGGIALFQSSQNSIHENTIRHNKRGIRVNATIDLDDLFDGEATANQLFDNVIENSTEFGIYLYARADQNLIQNNQISGSGISGIYIKSGGNQLEKNSVSDGENSIIIFGQDGDGITTDRRADAQLALEKSRHNNIILRSKIFNNRNVSIRILEGVNKQIGQTTDQDIHQNSDQENEITQAMESAVVEQPSKNLISNNAKDGIEIRASSSGKLATDNLILGNRIYSNGRHGIHIEGATSVHNIISGNLLGTNQNLDLSIANGAQSSIQPPTIMGRDAANIISGTAAVGAIIEIYSDTNLTDFAPENGTQQRPSTVNAMVNNASLQQLTAPKELLTMIGSTRTNSDGIWSFKLPDIEQVHAHLPATKNAIKLTALAIDEQGNTSTFGNQTIWLPGISYYILPDDNDQPTLHISGPGESITLADIQKILTAEQSEYIENMGDKTWRLRINLIIAADTTLNLDVENGLSALQLRSQSTPAGAITVAENGVDYTRHVYLATVDGTINISGVKIYSWDEETQSVDEDISNGRSYILARGNAALNIKNSDIGYLGFSDGESYGVSWRDVNPSNMPEPLLTRVTGAVIGSEFHHNYYGIYTFQASNMLFTDNKFHHNIRYGFDPHDYSHHFTIENNEAYSNGSHGFIISRGCNNMTFRNNRSYENADSGGNLAHGFMLDPGSPNSHLSQSPSQENRFENNEAYNNEGYGIRVLGSHNNLIIGNNFHHNARGLVLDPKSKMNLVQRNTVTNNQSHGIIVRETATDNIIIENSSIQNGGHGINILASNNRIERNRSAENQNTGISVRTANGFAQVTNTQIVSNTFNSNLNDGIELKNVSATTVEKNIIYNNGDHGIYLSNGAIQTNIEGNSIYLNNGNGIRTNGVETRDNRWVNNQIYANLPDSINNTSDANNGVLPPQIITVEATSVTGSAPPNTLIDIYSDDGNGGQYYEGSTTTGTDGRFTLTITSPWQAPNITAVATDVSGSSSEFAEHLTQLPAILYIYVPIVQK